MERYFKRVDTTELVNLSKNHELKRIRSIFRNMIVSTLDRKYFFNKTLNYFLLRAKTRNLITTK